MGNLSDDLDKALVGISTNASARSFKTFFDLTYDKLFRVALYYLQDEHHAKDVVSTVYIKLWEKRTELQHIHDIHAYLYTITKRRSLNYLRDHKIVAQSTQDFSNIKIVKNSPEDIFLSQELLNVIKKSIQDLPPKCQMVFQLVKEDKLKYKKVAEILEISEKTVEKHIGKALAKIRLDVDRYLNSGDIKISSKVSTLSDYIITPLIFLIFFFLRG